MASKRRRISRIDTPNPEAMALHAASVADVRAKRGPTTRAKLWYLRAGIPTPNHCEQWTCEVFTTLTRMDFFNGRSSGRTLPRPPVQADPAACPGL
jgi:hypothetical protein